MIGIIGAMNEEISVILNELKDIEEILSLIHISSPRDRQKSRMPSSA